MPQTTTAVSQACGDVEIAFDSGCSSWTDIGGTANSITGTEQTKMVAEEFTFDGNGPIVKVGKQEAFDLTLRIVYTQTASESYRLIHDEFVVGACDGEMCIRWWPDGKVAGNEMFETNLAPISSFQWPEINAAAAGPVMANVVLRVSTVDRSIYVS